MAVLVTGGAGYIGSVTVELLQQKGEDVVILDNLDRGHRESVDPSLPFYEGGIGDRKLVARIAREHQIESCVHFAALAYVGESVGEPLRYFDNNTAQGIALLESLVIAGVRRVVFSSTAATYGEPEQSPIPEEHRQLPTNPYGWSKYFMERVLQSCDHAHGLRYVALRYFNACGATARRGEHHKPETHLIPIILFAAMGTWPHVSIFGTDYPTPDGTAIRDYIHVADLASAHLLALKHLRGGGDSDCFNLGTGHGYSVKEVIETAERAVGHPIPTQAASRRAGDPSRLVATSDKARRILGWNPQQSDLATIIQSAWDWHQKHPDGYVNG